MRNADRESFRMVAETCPEVDKALDIASEAIKLQTGKLRDALIESISDHMDTQTKLDEALSKIQDLECDLDMANKYIRELESVAG